MMSRLIVAAIIVSSGGVAAAQTVKTVEVSNDDRHQIEVFESSLRAAIASAGNQLATRARQVVPNIKLQFESDAMIVPIILPQGEGLQFIVDVPGIEPRSASAWELARLIGARPELTGSRTNGSGSPNAPVATPKPDGVPVVTMLEPEKEYSVFAHDALVNALLDNAFALPIKDGQTLTLIVGNGTIGLPADPLAPPVKMLYLRMKGEDLTALRQNRITRDQAKKLILQWVH